jgi:hypothetical protein
MQFQLRRWIVGIVTVVAAFAAVPLLAQQTESRIIGSVLDASKAVLPGATVTVTSKTTGAVHETVTD